MHKIRVHLQALVYLTAPKFCGVLAIYFRAYVKFNQDSQTYPYSYKLSGFISSL